MDCGKLNSALQAETDNSMRRAFAPILLLGWLIGDIAVGEVIGTGPAGFSLTHEVTIEAARADVWRAAVGDIGLWWSSDHTISGNARNMSIDPRPQGCFCESLGDHSGVVHLTVTFVNPQVLLRLTGGLGPLGLMGVNGNMLWEFVDSNAGTIVTFSYTVGGYQPGGLDDLARPVDFVIGEALLRLKAHVETGDANAADTSSIE
jgi:uncharacterized protein YndB with AHSA1/START domain